MVLRHDPIDLRLLQHDFGDEDVVRIGSAAPRKVASVCLMPRQGARAGSAAATRAAAETKRTSPL